MHNRTTGTVERVTVDGGLKSVSTAFELLACFRGARELGVSDLARRLGVAKSTVHRLLTTLSKSGLVAKNPETGRYHLGLHLMELGQLAASRFPLSQSALPLLEDLRERTGYTVHLAVPDGVDVLYVERLHSPNGMRVFANSPLRLPAHSTSSGKAIAAFDREFAQRRLAAGFPGLTLSTITTPASWDRALDETRRRGVAVSRDEAADGLSSLAAPVRDHTGRARAAISIDGPSLGVADHAEGYARLVILAANKLAGRLPFTSSPYL
ncbi:IclR family transcriptional regulator [Streptomyces sp. RB6PN25]|uniref:IclR family transcriptional regulator n=1 Tax=Streptomyces humicola TaxID=2953240 RepID=A0ABT1PPT8_9ACTN|nr:IclR family transcriptional regulator [Streptomyces humicola]MCQ4079133.1 IclR family transcriptional regulator [Streptomyces humicola]